jgi:hypothetical protein
MAPRPGRRSSLNSRTLVNLDIYPTRYRASATGTERPQSAEIRARLARVRIFTRA